MFSRIFKILAFGVILVNVDVGGSPVIKKARQFLPPLPGFVPVYIRPGDTPLEEINPDLAEAFNSYAEKHARLYYGRANSVPDGKIHVQIADSLDNISTDFESENQNAVNKVTESHHIQKIPRT